MHPRTRTQRQTRRASGRGGMAAALLAALVNLAPGVATAQTAAAPSLKELFETAWARQPESLSLQARRDAVQAQRRAAEAWTPEPPALEASHKTDRLTRNDGARELEVGVAVPLWLPGERRNTSALADAEAAALGSRAEAARLRLAASVREAWWNWQRAGVEAEIEVAVTVNIRCLVHGDARDGHFDIRAVYGVETAQKDLHALALSAVSRDEQPGNQAQQIIAGAARQGDDGARVGQRLCACAVRSSARASRSAT